MKLHLTGGKTRILLACQSNQYALERISPQIDWKGFSERDLALVTASEKRPFLTYNVDGNILRDPVVGEYINKVIDLSNCDQKPGFVLIGKDGTVKYRWLHNVTTKELFEIIDAMPMRQYEMRTRNGN